MISFQKAIKIVWDTARVMPVESVKLLDCPGRVLSQDIIAKFDYPPFNRAAMDGYAIKIADTISASKKNPVILKIAGEIQAGTSKRYKIISGNCFSVLTGSMLPQGTQAVVKIEDVEILKKGNDSYIKIFSPVRKNENISFKGEDIRKGQIIIKKGCLIDSAILTMLAYLGKSSVKVRRQPHVSIVTTGDELLEPGTRLKKGKIYNSNGYGLYGLVKENCGIPHILGTAKDDENSLFTLLEKALNYDIAVISGGVSEGKFDLVVKVLKNLGVKELFWKVAIKPGKPVFFGKKDNTLVFGLPGYPVSTYLSFYNFVKTAMEKMLGYKKPLKKYLYGELLMDIKNSGDRTSLVRVQVFPLLGKNLVIPFHKQKSGMLSSIINTNGLVVVEKSQHLKKGEKVKVEILRSNFL